MRQPIVTPRGGDNESGRGGYGGVYNGRAGEAMVIIARHAATAAAETARREVTIVRQPAAHPAVVSTAAEAARTVAAATAGIPADRQLRSATARSIGVVLCRDGRVPRIQGNCAEKQGSNPWRERENLRVVNKGFPGPWYLRQHVWSEAGDLWLRAGLGTRRPILRGSNKKERTRNSGATGGGRAAQSIL